MTRRNVDSIPNVVSQFTFHKEKIVCGTFPLYLGEMVLSDANFVFVHQLKKIYGRDQIIFRFLETPLPY